MTETSDRVVIVVRGALDDEVAHDLYDSVAARAARSGRVPLEIDLREVDGWTTAGLRRLAECAWFQVRFRMGPHLARMQR